MNVNVFEHNATQAAELLRLMGNERRLMILCKLGEKELSVGALADHIGLSQSALSQHLAMLRQRGLVKTRRVSQTIYYSLADKAAMQIINTLYGIYCPAKTVKGVSDPAGQGDLEHVDLFMEKPID